MTVGGNAGAVTRQTSIRVEGVESECTRAAAVAGVAFDVLLAVTVACGIARRCGTSGIATEIQFSIKKGKITPFIE